MDMTVLRRTVSDLLPDTSVAVLSGSRHLGYADDDSDVDVDVLTPVDECALLVNDKLVEHRWTVDADGGLPAIEVVAWPLPKALRLIAHGDMRLTLAFGHDPTYVAGGPAATVERLAQMSLATTTTRHRIAHFVANQLTGYLMNRELKPEIACKCAVRAHAVMRVLASLDGQAATMTDTGSYRRARTNLDTATTLADECDQVLTDFVAHMERCNETAERVRLREEAARIVRTTLETRS